MNHIIFEELLRSCIRNILIEKRKHKKKPGGPRTNAGAIRQLNHDTFILKVKDAMHNAKGDVHVAAKQLKVSTRTLYHYLDDESKLGSVKTSSEIETAEEKKS